MKIIGIESNNGVYLCDSSQHVGYFGGTSNLKSLIINGEEPNNTFDPRWVKVSAPPKTVERQIGKSYTNHRFELIDKSMESEKIPLVIPKGEAYEGGDEYGRLWGPKYQTLCSLYALHRDELPPKLEPVSFKYFKLLEIPNLREYAGFSYELAKEEWNDGPKYITNEKVTYQAIDKIVFPSLLLADKKQKLTSKESYSIIRKHIQDNINPKWAKITSDYNFCFAVKKKILLAKPYKSRSEILTQRGKSYRSPKFKENLVSDKLIEVFEMTHSEDRYKGYTVVPGFEGENQEDLKNNIDRYLEELMTRINEPLKECPHCCGAGAVI